VKEMRLTNMVKIREILRLKSLGIGIRATAESCNCSRNTVREILRRAELQNLSWPLKEDMDDEKISQTLYPSASVPVSRKPEPDYQYIFNELKSPHVNLRLLWTEYKSQQPEGLAYSQFCYKYNEWAAKTKAVMHLDHKPGNEMFVDWAGTTMKVIDQNTGDIKPAYLFVSTIGTSAYPYVEAFSSQNLENWILAHIHAFEYYMESQNSWFRTISKLE
jgi:transposase